MAALIPVLLGGSLNFSCTRLHLRVRREDRSRKRNFSNANINHTIDVRFSR